MGLAGGSIEENGNVGILGNEFWELSFLLRNVSKTWQTKQNRTLGSLRTTFPHHFRIIFASFSYCSHRIAPQSSTSVAGRGFRGFRVSLLKICDFGIAKVFSKKEKHS